MDIRLQTIRPVLSTISPIGKAPKLTEGRHTENTKGQRTNHSSYCRVCLSLLRPGKASVPLLVHCKHRPGNGKARNSGTGSRGRPWQPGQGCGVIAPRRCPLAPVSAPGCVPAPAAPSRLSWAILKPRARARDAQIKGPRRTGERQGPVRESTEPSNTGPRLWRN